MNKPRKNAGPIPKLPLLALLFMLLVSFFINVCLFLQISTWHARHLSGCEGEDFPLGLWQDSSRAKVWQQSSSRGSSQQEPPKNVSSVEYAPVSCRDLLQQIRGDTPPIQDPNEGKGFVRLTDTKPKFFISLHSEMVDRVRWIVHTNGHYYETKLTEAIKDGLAGHPGGLFLDIGGNIGWFALWAAALGHNVAVFEMDPRNYMKMCESIHLNGWADAAFGKSPKIDLFPYGVGGVHGTEYSLRTRRNPGESELMEKKGGFDGPSGSMDVKGVALDTMAELNGWFDGNTTIAFMKVDVEGNEPEVFRGARKLMKSKIVKNIAVEFNFHLYGDAAHDYVEQLVEAGYVLFKMGMFRGPSNADVPASDGNLTFKLMNTGKRRALNLWFKLREEM